MRKLFKHIWPVLFILFVWFAFAYPYFLKHKVPFPSSYAVNFFPPWNPYHLYDGPVKNNAMPDVIDQLYPWRQFTISSWKQGQIPLWNPYSFSGTPHLANYQSAALSPLNILFFILPFVDAWSLLILLQPLLAGIFAYIYMRSLSASKVGSLITAVGFMFCGFMTTWMDYGTLGYAILFLPLSLFSIEKFFATKQVWYLLLLALTIPCSFFSGHFQTSLYFLLFIVVYLLYKLFITRKLNASCYLLVAISCGLLISMPQILPSLEFYTQSLRSNLFQQIEAIPLGYLPTLLAPDFFGNPVTRNDWYGHYAEWNGYIGLLPLFLGFYAVFRKRNKFTLFLGLASIIVLFLAFSTPVLQLLISLRIPVLSTSAASRIIVLFSFLFVVLAGIGFDNLIDDVKNKHLLAISIWLGSCLALVASLWIVVLFKLFLPLDKLVIAKQNLKLPTILFVLIVLCMFGVYFLKQLKVSFIQKNILVLLASCLLLLTVFDLLRFATKWQPFDPKGFVFPTVAAIRDFPQRPVYQRVVGSDGGQLSVAYHLPSIEGYDPLYIKRYGEFVASLNGSFSESQRSVVQFPKDALNTPRALQLLNVGDILQKDSDNYQPWGFPFTRYPSTQFSSIYNDGTYKIMKNTVLLSHAFFAQNYIIATKPQTILTRLFAPSTHLNSTLVLEEDPGIQQGGVSGNAEITEYTPNEIGISAQTNKTAMLFLSEVYYPGWHAYIDGKKTPIYRADYTFRSIVVPQGFHTVVFRYEPASFFAGCWLGLLGAIGIIVLVIYPRYRKLLQ